MDINNIVTNICNNMSTELSKEQLRKLEMELYTAFRNIKVVEDCRELQVASFDNDVFIVKNFLASKRLTGRAESTLEAYNLEIWIARAHIGKAFVDITTLDVKQYLGYMAQRGLSPTTLNNKRLMLNSFFKFLEREGFVEKNPVARIDPITEPKRQKHAFSIADIEAMRTHCVKPRDRALLEFLLSTGLRVSELTSLKIKDIDMEHRRFRVIGKGNKERVVFYNELTEYYLSIYLRQRLELEGKTFDEIKDEGLFVKTKKPYSPLCNNGVRMVLIRIAKESGVDNVYPHRFRRTFASTALHRNMPIDKLRRMMGHEKIETTLLYVDEGNDLETCYKMYIS